MQVNPYKEDEAFLAGWLGYRYRVAREKSRRFAEELLAELDKKGLIKQPDSTENKGRKEK